MNINQLALDIYAQNKAVGWWDDPDRCVYQTLQLVSTEIAEATEGERKNLMDDHLPDRKMGEVELADALIRVLDIGGRYGMHYCDLTSSHYFINIHASTGKLHLGCNMALCELADYYDLNDFTLPHASVLYSQLINSIIRTAVIKGYDIEGAMTEKLEYNKHRIDHKRETRQGKHGKAF